MKKLQTNFILKTDEVTEERYYEMLGCLPPERMASNAFLVGEPMDHRGDNGEPRYQMFFSEGKKYYDGGLCTVKDFETFLIPELYTREDYLANKCTHSQYYAQFVTKETCEIVEKGIGRDALMASTDEHLNDIRLGLWDSLANYHLIFNLQKFKEAGDSLSPAGKVCILKEAARQIIAEHRRN